MNTRTLLAVAFILATWSAAIQAGDSACLWQIGQADDLNAEFALAPDQYAKYAQDGFFVVNASDSRTDWPYVHPGPNDAWAGSRAHTFVILFGLQRATNQGECHLRFKILDTQAAHPPRLAVEINGHRSEHALPAGAGDDSVQGKPEKGKSHEFSVTFPSAQLKLGDNAVFLTTQSGCWLLYDWVGLETPAGFELAPVQARSVIQEARAIMAMKREENRLLQPVEVVLHHRGDPNLGVVQVGPSTTQQVRLTNGIQRVEVMVPAVSQETELKVTLMLGSRTVASRPVTLKPVRPMTVYILPHSHTDIGYTDLQTAIEEKQVNNLRQGLEIARKTAGYPEGARFVWNVEVLWAADLYLRRLSMADRQALVQAVEDGQVSFNGMYLNELTGLCRDEELIRLFSFATKLSDYARTPIDSVMISDVPGYTWGTVTAMAEAGIRYFSTAPNYFDRIGTILREWENKPFYWLGPDGKTKVLVWIPYRGYALSHLINRLTPAFSEEMQTMLEKTGYEFDIAHVRWSGHGDNAVPDDAICEFVKEWNIRYDWPKFIISSVSTAFRAFEEKYGDRLPVVRGDWTPYWEDGAASSALETAMNRASSDRLTQAETLYALRQPRSYPAGAFEDAWNQVLLYSEHTWGAWCSVSGPERKETSEQWAIKRGYALQADRFSRELMDQARASLKSPTGDGSVDVYNTLSWERGGLVTLPATVSTAGDRVLDDRGKPVPSQRMSSGELVFKARPMPPYSQRRYRVVAGTPFLEARVQTWETMLDNGQARVALDPQTGGIREFTVPDLARNFVNTTGGETLNDYLYFLGDNPKDARRNGPITVKSGETGPLIASLIVDSDAPGCRHLRREIRMVAGCNLVELINTVDKERLVATNYFSNSGKESLNFAFPFNVRDGQMRIQTPFAIVRPELDQMPSACKNWFTVGRWVDVSDDRHGITWVTLDAPLVQVGGLTANLLNSQTNPSVWRNRVERTQRLYSWAMNNHWGTNYRAYQEGPVVFRFVLLPHGTYDPAAAMRFGLECSHPLVAMPAEGPLPTGDPLVLIKSDEVVATGLKPSDDGQALILRLFGADEGDIQTRVQWIHPVPADVFLSDTSEKALTRLSPFGAVEVPGQGVTTLRANLK
ncbi:MAG TPA: polysaccharide lyase family protein [Candidatus Paceibacterota bacterium]|nr:polysaccharide lyase family protein [Candidatus Paceibacterota bacterium]